MRASIVLVILLAGIAYAGQAPIAELKKGDFKKGTVTYGPFPLPPSSSLTFSADVDDQSGLIWSAVLDMSTDKVVWKTILNCTLTGDPAPPGKASPSCSIGDLGKTIPGGSVARVTVTANQDCQIGFSLH